MDQKNKQSPQSMRGCALIALYESASVAASIAAGLAFGAAHGFIAYAASCAAALAVLAVAVPKAGK